MEKRKSWQLALIIGVLLWTAYHILPTVIYYTRPLHQPVTEEMSRNIATSISRRIMQLEEDTVSWIRAFCRLIGVSPSNIHIDDDDPALVWFHVKNEAEAEAVKRFFPRAGMAIPFKPGQLFLGNVQDNTVQVIRRLGVRIDESNQDKYFQFFVRQDAQGVSSDQYFSYIRERFVAVASSALNQSTLSKQIALVVRGQDPQMLERVVDELFDWMGAQPKDALLSRVLRRAFVSVDGDSNLQSFIDVCRRAIARETASQEGKDQREEVKSLMKYQQIVSWLETKQSLFEPSATRSNISKDILYQWIDLSRKKDPVAESYCCVLDDHPSIHSITVDWGHGQFIIRVHEDISDILQLQGAVSEQEARLQDVVNRMVLHEVARISKETREDFQGEQSLYRAPLLHHASSNGVLTLSLDEVATQMLRSLLTQIHNEWAPESVDFQEDAYPQLQYQEYQKADPETQQLCLLAISPLVSHHWMHQLKSDSLYLILRGGQRLFSYKDDEILRKDFQRLAALLEKRGFIAYSGEVFGEDSAFSGDIIFELEEFVAPVLEATREDFYVPGHLDVAFLECGTVETRIAAENRIDDLMQEELIKWKETWQAAQVSLNPMDRYTIPRPTKNVLWSNWKTSWLKYWRGDSDRILRWGLDLSGGKSIRLALVDQANRPVSDPKDLEQATSELYARLNKMGVSERTIRIENTTISIDFPGVHGLSAAELVKASAMYFHVVNEQFGFQNSELAKATDSFLQDVWNEAVVTNRKEISHINAIAWKKVEAVQTGLVADENIQLLLDQGLVLADPSSSVASSDFNDRISMIARWQSDDPAEWVHGHPLLVVFHNFALEGSDLENVHPSYDPSKGNILLFGVKSKDMKGERPADLFYTWTSQFSEEGIIGTVREKFSQGRGWRMAVILNGVVISAPQLSSALKDSAMITGNFSQREVQKLAANLQAGSLSFTPKILSEQNVSPELGLQERFQGLLAAALSLVAVIIVMVGYYRHGGVVASCAVVFNLFILWAVMQNIDAAITLPAIAGVVLTVAMAVDANVLVFERIREEFKVSGRIASAISRGYQKALSAIVDSNLTTILAAFILTQFDCGPVRGFAVTLIIGLLSSMFTSLFVTRYYFVGWAENPKHTHLSMAEWIRGANFDFLSWRKVAFVSSLFVVIAGLYITVQSWRSMLGMDFTGGYALVVETTSSHNPKQLAEKALLEQGVLPNEVEIRELGRPTALRIQLSSSLNEPDRPFSNVPEYGEGEFDYQKNPRLDWVISSLEKGGVSLDVADKDLLIEEWTEISGQFSSAMRNNALMALGLSLVAILVYIAIRFEWKYALSAVLALLLDVLLTMAVIAICYWMGMSVQINLEVIGALMTIIGYALNDTIIIFDRVREDLVLYRRKQFSEIVNLALNSTLSRTVMTSVVTLLVLLCLVVFGGSSIFLFSFVMFVGVLLGTISSLFVAGPLLVFFHMKEESSEKGS